MSEEVKLDEVVAEAKLEAEKKLNTTTTKETTTKKKEEINVSTVPSRVLPPIVEELLDKNIRVELTKSGYLVHGFYGLDRILLQETDTGDVMVAYDHKNKKQIIKEFKDLVELNSIIWANFYKKPEYRKPDNAWFNYLLEYEFLELSPSK